MRILFATDGSETSVKAAHYIMRLFAPFAVQELTVVAVQDTAGILAAQPFVAPTFQSEAIRAEEERTNQAIEEARELFSRNGFKVRVVKREGIPSNQILEEARQSLPELIVLGSHGRRGLEGMVMGSVSQSIAKEARCSVLIVK